MEFEQEIKMWAQRVINECSAIATNPSYEIKYLFYPLQSGTCFNPEILFIGTNPGSKLGYRDETVEKDILCQSENLFLKNYDNPEWKNFKPLTEMFQTDLLKPLFERANIINMFYFNSGTYDAIKTNKGAKQALETCQRLTLEYIQIVKPKSIIIFGKPAKVWMSKLVNEKKFTLLQKAVNDCELIGTSHYNGIPVFTICHPTTSGTENRVYNSPANVELKRKKFEEIYKEILK